MNAPSGRLLVTTSRGAGEEQRERAERVAARCGAELSLKRPGLEALFEDFSLVYVVSRRRDEIVAPSGERTFVHQAMVRSISSDTVSALLCVLAVGRLRLSDRAVGVIQ